VVLEKKHSLQLARQGARIFKYATYVTFGDAYVMRVAYFTFGEADVMRVAAGVSVTG
jgi:hypothetical protein